MVQSRSAADDYNVAVHLAAFPGGDLVAEGIEDLAQGRETIPALLVSIGAPRLQRLGLPVPKAVIASLERRCRDPYTF